MREHRAANIHFGIRLADGAADTEQRKEQVVAAVGWTAAPVESALVREGRALGGGGRELKVES